MAHKKQKIQRNFWLCIGIFIIALLFAWPNQGWGLNKTSWPYFNSPLKKGLDIAGGMQVILEADMSNINEVDRPLALDAARDIIARRVDAFGLTEPNIQTSTTANQYRILVELPEVTDQNQALALIGQTAQMDFRLQDPNFTHNSDTLLNSATTSAQIEAYNLAYLNSFQPTDLTGEKLQRASVQFDPSTNLPTILLEFNDSGRELFAQITQNNIGVPLGIFIDNQLITAPTIQTAIIDGNAIISGNFTVESAQDLAIQLNSGALPVPINILEQKVIGATLGDESVATSLRAGIIGLIIVCLFMILVYGYRGIFSWINLLFYTVIIIAIYKIFGITLTLAGIAGLLLSIGMAVDSNILIFERLKDEIKSGVPTLYQALDSAFLRAWDSIRDANIITLTIAFVLANPLDFAFLNTSGTVRGFGVTLLIGTIISLFTGVFVTQTMMRFLLKNKKFIKKLKKQSP